MNPLDEDQLANAVFHSVFHAVSYNPVPHD